MSDTNCGPTELMSAIAKHSAIIFQEHAGDRGQRAGRLPQCPSKRKQVLKKGEKQNEIPIYQFASFRQN